MNKRLEHTQVKEKKFGPIHFGKIQKHQKPLKTTQKMPKHEQTPKTTHEKICHKENIKHQY